MFQTRRGFLARTASGICAAPLALRAMGELQAQPLSEDQILPLFDMLPGDKAVKIFAPAVDNKPEFLLELNASKLLFVGSAIKTFILAKLCGKPRLRASLKPSRGRSFPLTQAFGRL